jgi:hypothetical protein
VSQTNSKAGQKISPATQAINAERKYNTGRSSDLLPLRSRLADLDPIRRAGSRSLVDGDVTLTESHAILPYLGETAPLSGRA